MRLGILVLTLAPFALSNGAAATPNQAEDAPATHNMLVVGHQTVFLSHLPMFEALRPNGSEYTSPHRYQVILQATLEQPTPGCGHGRHVTSTYQTDRASNKN